MPSAGTAASKPIVAGIAASAELVVCARLLSWMSNVLPTRRHSGAHNRNVSSVLVSCAVSHRPVLSPIKQLPNARTAPTTHPIAIGSQGSGRSATLRSYRPGRSRGGYGYEYPIADLRVAHELDVPIEASEIVRRFEVTHRASLRARMRIETEAPVKAVHV